MKKILCVLLAIMLVAGLAACGESASATQPTTMPTEAPTEPPVSYTLYLPNDNADGLNEETVQTQILFPETVLAELKKRNVLPDGVAMNRFDVKDGQITIDFNQAFADAVCAMGTSGELMIMGSVVNTFLDAFQAESAYFTVDGQILESGHVVYDFEMTFFSFDPQPVN